MRLFGLACAFAALAAGALAPVPAYALSLDWKAANAAYHKGRSGASRPASSDDYVQCAAYWAAWTVALNDEKVTGEEQGQLDVDLQLAGAEERKVLWRFLLAEDDATLDAFYDKRDSAEVMLDKALGGNREPLSEIMGVLGTCQVPSS